MIKLALFTVIIFIVSCFYAWGFILFAEEQKRDKELYFIHDLQEKQIIAYELEIERLNESHSGNGLINLCTSNGYYPINKRIIR